MAGKQSEQAELAGRVSECQAKLEGKVQDLRNLATAKQQVHPCHVTLLNLCNIALLNTSKWYQSRTCATWPLPSSR